MQAAVNVGVEALPRSGYLGNSGVALFKVLETGIFKFSIAEFSTPESGFPISGITDETYRASGCYPRRMLSKNSLLFLVALSLPSRNSVASSSSIG